MQTPVIRTPEDAAELAAQLPFSELSPELQQAAVAILGSAGEYNALRAAILAARAALREEAQHQSEQSAQFPAKAPDSLHRALAKHHGKPVQSPKIPFLLRPVPLYRVGLAAALAAFTVAFFYRPVTTVHLPSPNRTVAEKIVYRPVEFDRDSLAMVIADSVYKLLAKKSLALRRKSITPAETSPAPFVATDAERRILPHNAFVGLDNVPITLAQRRGISSDDNTALEKFTSSQSSLR